ncbi:uncharacterized protein LOC136036193 isoform X3 [Artemia franciscana]
MDYSKSPDRFRVVSTGPISRPYETQSLSRQPSRDTVISKISQSYTDVSIQVDVPEVENTKMRRKRGDRYTKKGTPIYSKEDIREQYCINEKELEVLEKGKKRSIFGCMSKHRAHSKRSSLLPCVRGASDDNLPHTYVVPLKPPASPTKKAFTLPSQVNQNEYEEVKRRPRSVCIPDVKNLEDLESRLLEKLSRPNSDERSHNSSKDFQSPCPSTKIYDGSKSGTPFNYGGRIGYTHPNTPDFSTLPLRRQLQSPDSPDERRAKHVSFDASSPQHGSPGALQEHVSSLTSLAGERLLDARKSSPEDVLRKLAESAALSPLIAKALILEKLKKASMKTQATQTDSPCSRRPTPSSEPSSKQVNMESRGSQTMLEILKTRKLIKSLSAVNSGASPNDIYYMEVYNFDFNGERTRSEELVLDSISENEKRSSKLTKAYSEGAILVKREKSGTPEKLEFTDDEAESDSEIELFVGPEISPPVEFVGDKKEGNILQLPRQKSVDSISGEVSQTTVLWKPAFCEDPGEQHVVISEMEVTRQWNSETDAHCLSHHASGESDSYTVLSTPTSTRSFKLNDKLFTTSPNGPRLDTIRSKKSLIVTTKHYWNVSVESESSYCPVTEKETDSDPESVPSVCDDKEKVNCHSESFLTAIGNFESATSCTTVSTDSFATALPDKENDSSKQSTLKTQASYETISSPSDSRVGSVASPCLDPLPAVQEVRVSSDDDEVKSSSSGSYSLGCNLEETSSLKESKIQGRISSQSCSSRENSGDKTSESGNSGMNKSNSEGKVSPDIGVLGCQNIDKCAKEKQTISENPKSHSIENVNYNVKTADMSKNENCNSPCLEERLEVSELSESARVIRARDSKTKTVSEKRYTRYFDKSDEIMNYVIEVPTKSPAAKLKIKSVEAETECEQFDAKKMKDSFALHLPSVSSPLSERRNLSPSLKSVNYVDSSSDEEFSSRKLLEKRRTPESESKREILKISTGRKSKSRSRSPDAGAKRRSAERHCYSQVKKIERDTADLMQILHREATEEDTLCYMPSTPDTPGMVRSPAMHEGFRIEDWTIVGTDEKSLTSTTPDKKRKKKKACRSDTKSLPRASIDMEQIDEKYNEENVIFPANIEFKRDSCSERNSEVSSERKEDKNLLTLDPHSATGISLDSLRSASPGSDSVFLSECLDIVPTPLSEETRTPESGVSMVQPPEGFEDSPCSNKTMEFFLGQPALELCKVDSRKKRARSCTQLVAKEDLYHARSFKSLDRKYNKRIDEFDASQRSHSEERILSDKDMTSWNFETRNCSRPFVFPHIDDEDSGVYDDSYRSGNWMYIGENEELVVWGKLPPPTAKTEDEEEDDQSERCLSDTSTSSEKDFRKKYTAVTHRLVHRKASMEMFRRMGQGSTECDERIVIRREEGGEFGFRIHGSRPVVVSAIEPGTPADVSGLAIGDVVIALNGNDILDVSHTEVVSLAHAGADELTLDVIRTSMVLEREKKSSVNETLVTISGQLWKQSINSYSEAHWLRRWLVLKTDNCLYFYRKEDAAQPTGVVMMEGLQVSRTSTPEKDYAIILSKSGVTKHILAADDENTANHWAACLFQAAASATQHDIWMSAVRKCIQSFPDQITSPDCQGILSKLGHRVRVWTKYYCLLKDACLYFYNNKEPSNAIGVVFLHGYRVQSSTGGGRRLGFELLPSDPRHRHFHLSAESDFDRKRWLAALEYSIDRWICIG